MSNKVLVVTAKKGALANDRRVLANVSAATAAPTLSSDGDFLNRIEYLHLLFKLTNTDSSNSCTFYVQVWWWSAITDMWHKGEMLKVNDNDIHTIENQGLNRIYLQVTQKVYGGSTTPTLDAWVGMVVPV